MKGLGEVRGSESCHLAQLPQKRAWEQKPAIGGFTGFGLCCEVAFFTVSPLPVWPGAEPCMIGPEGTGCITCGGVLGFAGRIEGTYNEMSVEGPPGLTG